MNTKRANSQKLSNKTNKAVTLIILLIISSLFFTDCANIGTLTGGDKDTISPVVVRSSPPIKALNFEDNELVFKFDEFVVLDNMRGNFYSSPPLKNFPKFSIKGKKVITKFDEELKDSITYFLNYGSGIKDYHEGNPLKNFAFVFSTGDHIDSMAIQGTVYDAESQKPEPGVPVMLYSENNDSLPLLETPMYYAVTDTSGKFTFHYLRQGKYKIFSLQDNDANMLFNLPNEKIGYLDSLLTTSVETETIIDTVKAGSITASGDTLLQDSISKQIHYTYSPHNISIFTFEEDHQKQYLKDLSRTMFGRLEMNFNLPTQDVNFQFADSLVSFKDTIVEYTDSMRTQIVWLNDSLLFKNDSIVAFASYLALDSAGENFLHTDTLTFMADSSQYDTVTYAELQYESFEKHHYYKDYNLTFNIPPAKWDTTKITLYELIDTAVTETKKQALQTQQRPKANELLFGFLRPVNEFSVLINDSILNCEILFDNNRDTVRCILPNFAAKTDTLNLDIYFDNDYFFGQIQKLNQEVVMPFTLQNINRLRRQKTNTLEIDFEKPQSEKITLKELNTGQIIEYVESKSLDEKTVTLILKQKNIIDSDTLLLSVFTDDGTLPNGTEIKFTDTVSAIYAPVKQFVKKAERVSGQGFYLLFNREIKQSDTEIIITNKTKQSIKPILAQKDSLYFDDISWRSIDTLKIGVEYSNERGIQVKDSFLLNIKKQERFVLRRESDKQESSNLSNITIEKKVPFKLIPDSINSRIFSVKADWNGNNSYNLITDSTAFVGIFGKSSKAVEKKFQVNGKDSYGMLILDIINTGNFAHPEFYKSLVSDTVNATKLDKGQLILYLYNEKEELIDEVLTQKDTTFVFNNLLPQKYSLRTIYDENNNGEWDTGNYLENIQPERVILYPLSIPIKETWEVNIEWNIAFKQKK